MITINGKVISKSGNCNNIVVSNGKVIVDGNDVTPSDEKTINITVNGDISFLNVDSCHKINVTGVVGSISNRNGDIMVNGTVENGVSNLNGDITCGVVHGQVKTVNGTIKHN